MTMHMTIIIPSICLYSETCLIRSGLGQASGDLIRQVAALYLTSVMWSNTSFRDLAALQW